MYTCIGMREATDRTISLADISPPVLRALLTYIYTVRKQTDTGVGLLVIQNVERGPFRVRALVHVLWWVRGRRSIPNAHIHQPTITGHPPSLRRRGGGDGGGR